MSLDDEIVLAKLREASGVSRIKQLISEIRSLRAKSRDVVRDCRYAMRDDKIPRMV